MYKIGQKVKIINDKSILGSNDALSEYLGMVVTIKTKDEDNVYTVEEIDGIEISNIDIECIVNKTETKEYKFFWVDPAFKDGPDSHSSGLCEIVDFPLLSMSFKCYAHLEYENYHHSEDEGRYGVEIGDYNIDKDCLESYENTWFHTEALREEYIKKLGLPCNVDIAKPEFFNNPDVYMDLRNYPSDTIFNIKLENGSEAEVYQNELFQRVQINISGVITLFVRFEADSGDDVKMYYSPMLKDGKMSPYYIDYNNVNNDDRYLPLQLIVNYCFLETNYTNGVTFDFEGNDEIEGFYATIVSFKFDTDSSIIATIVDMENNYFDVSWNEIKESNFELYL